MKTDASSNAPALLSLRLVVIALTYYGAHRLALLFLDPVQRVSAVWPASGLALAAVLLSPQRHWPAVVAVLSGMIVLSNIVFSGSFASTIGFASANVLELALGVWLFSRTCGPAVTFTRIVEVLVLIGVATLVNAGTALIGAATAALTNGAPFWASYWTWWTSVCLGILLVTPLLVTWARGGNPLHGVRGGRALEAAAFMIVWCGAAWLVYDTRGMNSVFPPLPYLLLALLPWAALRLGPRGVTTALVILAVIVLSTTLASTGPSPLGGQSPTERLLLVQIYIGITALTGLLLAASMTETTTAVQAARTSAERLQLALDAARMGVWEWTIATNRVDWSEQAAPIFGLDQGSFTSTFDGYLKLIYPQDRPMVTRTVEAALQSGTSDFVIEHRILWPDGSTRWLEGRGRVFHDLAGRPVRMAGTVMDITTRKQAEERSRAISELVSDYTFGFQVAADGAIRLEWVTDVFTRVTGHTQDVVGSIEAWEQLIDPDDLVRVRTERVKILAGETIVQEYRVRHNDGQMLWLRVYSRPIIDAVSGRVTHIYGAAQDITRLKHLEQQLLQAQKLDAMGRLAGGIAHDFNNLLTVILGNTDLLAGLDAAQPFHHEVAQVRDAAERAARLTRQLLAFSRKQPLVPRLVDLNTVVAEIAPLLRRLIGEHITLRTQLAPTLGQVLADPGQLEQVIVNLAVNARDAMPEGGSLILETANAVLDAPTGGEYVLLAVSDTGVGMDAQTRERIFEPFFTTKDVGKGTGLGLATVYGIVTQSGGRIWVYSEVGQGTTIKAYLPRHDAPVQAIEGQTPEGGAPDEWGKATILLVEDDVGVRELVERLLRSWGYQVLIASDATDALRVADAVAEPIDLLLTDVIMPGGTNGVALAAQLLAAQPSLRVLYMSGYTNTALTSQAVLVAGQTLMMKPFTANVLAQAVRAALAPLDTLPAPAEQA